MIQRIAHTLFAMATLLSLGVFAAAAGEPVRSLRVVVTIPPLLWPVQQILGEGPGAVPAEITLLLKPGLSEHGFELTPSQINAVRSADIVVMAGHALEPRVEELLKSAPNPARSVVSFEGLPGTLPLGLEHQHCDHDHEHAHGDDAHNHAATDPHLWLDPVAMKALLDRLSDATLARLSERGPDAASAAPGVRARAQAAAARCDEIDAAYSDQLAPLSNRTIVTHHNAYAYLCKRYNLTVAAVIRPIETLEPTPGDVMKAVKALKEQKAAAVFVEPQFPAGVARRIAETARVRLQSIDPLGDGDWPALMLANLRSLVDGLSSAGAKPPSPRP